MYRRLSCLLLAACALAGPATAGDTIDLNEFLRVGRFTKWRFQELNDQGQLEDDFRTVGVVGFSVKGEDRRYTIRLPDVGGVQALLMTVSRSPDGDLTITRLQIVDEEIEDLGSVAPIVLDPPLVLGGESTSLNDGPDEFEVDTSFKVKLKLGPVSKTFTVMVDGTITIDVTAADLPVPTLAFNPDDFDDPANLIGTEDLVVLDIFLDIVLSVDEDGVDEEAVVNDQIRLHLARDTGVVWMEQELLEENFDARVLVQAILPGRTIGPFPENEDITAFDFPTNGVFTLDGNTDSSTLGGAALDSEGAPAGTLMLDDVVLEHSLGGQLTMTALASFNPGAGDGGPTQVPITLKGKSVYSTKTETAKLSLKGTVKGLDGLTKPTVISCKAVIDEFTEALTFSFKSGKDAAGTFELGISPDSSSSADVSLDGLVDTLFLPPKARPLGSEGTMDVAGLTVPITVWEKKVVPKPPLEGQEPKPIKRTYIMRETGKLGVLAAFTIEELDESFAVTKFKGKLFGTPITVEDPEFDIGFSDSF